MSMQFYDAHFHIFDPRFPISKNQGYLPDPFTVEQYITERDALMAPLKAAGGVVVSASFQGFDQSYLLDALESLGSDYVGITQIPYDYPDRGIESLGRQRVRGLRFNLHRGMLDSFERMEALARRVHDLVGWHCEFYIDAAELNEAIFDRMCGLPQVVLDHLGLSRAGLPAVLRLAEKGVRIKATGFYRGDLAEGDRHWLAAMKSIHDVNPHALMFGTDLPSTRAPQPLQRDDVQRILDLFPESELRRIFYENARSLYQR